MTRSAGAWDVARVEAAKALRQPSTWVELGIVVGYALVLTLALSSALVAPSTQGLDPNLLLKPLRADAVGFVADVLTSIALLVLVVFAAQTVGQEFSRGTLRTILLSRVRRSSLAAGKAIALGAAALAIAIVIVAVSVLAAWCFSLVTGEALLHATALDVAALAGRTFLALLLWALLTFGVTLLVRGPGVAIGSVLGLLIVGDVLRGLLAALGTAGTWATRALPNTAISHVTAKGGPAGAEWLWIAPNLLVWVGGLNAWALVKLARMDVIAATK